ncbi:uncharacterized protein TNCV_5034341 [Trichonephila clavipes]|nr:uncharacterized protein TNCV_5034341 [Trichonephila clavipes]
MVPLLFQKLLPLVKQYISSSRRQAPVHEWYEGNRPGAALPGTSSRQDEIIVARLRSGHTRAQWHVSGLEVYPPCPNCNMTQAAPAHILVFIGCHKSQLLLSPATVLHCLKTHEFMDFI